MIFLCTLQVICSWDFPLCCIIKWRNFPVLDSGNQAVKFYISKSLEELILYTTTKNLAKQTEQIRRLSFSALWNYSKIFCTVYDFENLCTVYDSKNVCMIYDSSNMIFKCSFWNFFVICRNKEKRCWFCNSMEFCCQRKHTANVFTVITFSNIADPWSKAIIWHFGPRSAWNFPWTRFYSHRSFVSLISLQIRRARFSIDSLISG